MIQLTKKEESCHRLELEAINLKRIHLENKEEIKRLKTKFFDLTKEVKYLKTFDKTNKCKKVLEETKEMVINLKNQLEEAKEIEEALTIRLTKKEESCHILELEVVNLKNKNENTNATFKFHNNSTILDRIWNIQRPTNEKTGIGYNNKEESCKWTLIHKHEEGSSSSKGKSVVIDQIQAQKSIKKGSYKIQNQEAYQKEDFSCQNRIE
jgi:hypothetical protein